MTSFTLGTVFSGVLAAIRLWYILFASSDSRISRKIGADKRTSGFPFKNVEADKQKGRKGIWRRLVVATTFTFGMSY